MPLYEYACAECKHEFEALVMNGERPHCPRCESRDLGRLLSVPARPRSAAPTLPTACSADLPPCARANCCRLPQD